MMRQGFRLGLHDFWKLLLEGVANHGVQLRAPRFQQARIRSVSHQYVLEGVGCVRNFTPAEYEPRSNQSIERLSQLCLRKSGYGIQQFIGEGAADDSTDLCHLSYRRQAVEARYQRVMQCGRDRKRR